MKYTIMGFSQPMVIELNKTAKHKITIEDLAILRWIIDFTPKMSKHIEGEEIYYWLEYKHLLEDMPIIDIKKDSLYRRLSNLVDAGILTHKTIRKKGTYSYYGFGEKYKELISDPTEKNPEGYGKKSVGGTEKNPEQNNPSTSNPSTIEKDNIAETEVSAFSLHKNCVEYWCKEIKPEYSFTKKDGKHIKELYEKLRQSLIRKKNGEEKDEDVFESFKLFCSNIKNIDKFYHNMDIPQINSQFNPISEKIRNYILSEKGKPKLTELKPIWEQELTEKDFQNPLDYENYLYLKNRYKNGTK